MKKVFLLTLLAFSAIAAFATDPAKFLPSDAALVYYINGARLNQIEADSQAALLTAQQTQCLTRVGNPNIAQALTKIDAALQKACAQLFSGDIFMTADKAHQIILFNTAIPEKSMVELLTNLTALSGNLPGVKFQCQVIQSGNQVIYALSNASRFSDKSMLCFSYVADDVLLVFQQHNNDLAAARKALQNLGGNSIQDKLDRSQLLNFCLDFNRLGLPDPKLQQIGFDGVSLFVNELDNQTSIIKMKFYCLSQQNLQQVKQGVPFCMMMVGGLIFQNDPSIFAELMQGFALSAEGNDLTISLKITDALDQRINAYFNNPANFAGLLTPEMLNHLKAAGLLAPEMLNHLK